MVRPLPAKVAWYGSSGSPIGRQPAPFRHQASPASTTPFPSVSKSRSASSSYPVQPACGQPIPATRSGNAAAYAASPDSVGAPSPSVSWRIASSCASARTSISPSSSSSKSPVPSGSTVTRNVWVAVSPEPPPSVAVTVTVAAPTACGVTVTAAPETSTVTIADDDETAR